MGEIRDDLVDIEFMNIDQSCNFECEDCERYFECGAEEKFEIFSRGRMDLAKQKLKEIKYKIATIGGKGGTGKTVVSTNLAMYLASKGYKTAIVDCDFDSPCVPRIFGMMDKKMKLGKYGIEPVEGPFGLKAVSTGFILKDADVITWYSDMRRTAIEEFLAHVNYGKLDYLVLDLPPGTGVDTINMMQYIPDLDGMIIVTTPSILARATARRAMQLSKSAGVPILGLIENMGGFKCSDCGKEIDVFTAGGGKELAEEAGVRFLGKVPLDNRVAMSADDGIPFVAKYPDYPASIAFREIAEKIIEIMDRRG